MVTPQQRFRLPEDMRVPVIGGIASALLAIGAMHTASRTPTLVVGALIGLLFVCIVMSDLTLGLCGFVILQFFETLPGNGGQDITLVKVAGGVLALGWIATLTSARQRGRATSFVRSYPVVSAAMIAFLIWGTLGFTWAPAGDLVQQDLQRFALNFVLVAIIFTAIRSIDDLTRLAGAYVIGGALSALAGIALMPASDNGRLSGTVGQANDFAAALVPAAILALALAWTARSRGMKILYGAASAMAIGGMTLSLSRLGFIALPIAFLTWAAFGGRWRPRIVGMLFIAGAVAVAFFLLAAPSQHRDRLFMSDNGSGRTDLWTVALRVWESHPIRGVGYGNYIEVAPQYVVRPGLLTRTDLIIEDPHPAHNMYLGVLSQGGLVGLALLLIIIGGTLLASGRAARIFEATGDRRAELLARSLIAAQAGVLAAGFFIYTQFDKPMWILLGMSLAVLELARQTRAERRRAGLIMAPRLIPEPPAAR